MSTYFLPLVTLLLSCSAHANLVLYFVTVDKTKYSQISDLVEIQNLPKIQSQGSWNICFGMSSAVVANHYYCKHNNLDCKKSPRTSLVSPLEMTSYGNRNDSSAAGGTSGNHTNIRFGGSGVEALFYAAKLSVAMADSCFDFDYSIKRYGENEEMFLKTLSELEGMYNKQKTESSSRVDRLTQFVNERLGSNATPKDVQIALKGDDFSEFLYFTTVGRRSCSDLVEFEPEPKVGIHPPNDGTKETTYEDMMAKIKEVLTGR